MEELEEIKKEVSKKQIFEPIAAEPLPHEVVDIEKMIEDAPLRAPIFVKIEKYKDILNKIQDLKTTIKDIKSVLSIRKEIHNINSRSDEMLEKAFKKFSNATDNFNREFVMARGMKYLPEEQKNEVADGTISRLTDEVMKLKEELEELEV